MKISSKNFILIGIIVLIFLSFISIFIGNVQLSVENIFKILLNKISNKEIYLAEWKKSSEFIVWNLRVPRALLCILVGSGLSIIGILMQALTKNSLASPYILGISSGASFGAVSSIVLGGVLGMTFPTTIGAFVFGTLTAFLVFFLSGSRGYTTSKLILTGVAISSFFSGMTTFLVLTAKNEADLKGAMFWISGSLAGARWEDLNFLFIALLFTIFLVSFKYKELNILILGDELAQTIGLDIVKFRFFIVIISTLLTGFIVSLTGIIGFVGLIIPHICRGVVGSNHKSLIPASILLGAVFLLAADILTRLIFKNQEIPIGVITSIVGAPFFMSMLRKKSYNFGG